jgi:tripartite-type tricarboxylate transporter receptor subunit TctC
VAKLVKLARARPGQLNYASGGNGTTSHLAGEMFKNMAGVNIVHVPYKGVLPGVIDLISGHVHMSFAIMQSAYPHVQAGKLRGLAVSGAKRSPSAPVLPTISESGVPGYEFTSWNGVHVTAGTPRAVVTRIHAELVRVVALPDVEERMFGLENRGLRAEQLRSLVVSDIASGAGDQASGVASTKMRRTIFGNSVK